MARTRGYVSPMNATEYTEIIDTDAERLAAIRAEIAELESRLVELRIIEAELAEGR